MPDMGDEMGPVLETGLSQENLSTVLQYPLIWMLHIPQYTESWMVRRQKLPESSTHTHVQYHNPSSQNNPLNRMLFDLGRHGA